MSDKNKSQENRNPEETTETTDNKNTVNTENTPGLTPNTVPILSVNYILVPKFVSNNVNVNNINVNNIIEENNNNKFINFATKTADKVKTDNNGKLSISTFLENFYLLPYEIDISGGNLTNKNEIPIDTEVGLIDGASLDTKITPSSIAFHGGNNQRQLEGGYYSNHSNKPKGRKFANTKHTKKNHKRSYYKK